MKILIAGAGAMCCEILKQLKIFNYDITIVDFDLVEPTNLTTSLFYTPKDISFPKTLALKKLGYKVINSKIQSTFLKNYDIIISALDNLESRMDLNLLFMESNSKYLIDVGVNGLKGHIKVVNKNNACLFCIKHIYDKEDNSCGSKRDDVIPTVIYFNAIMAGCVGKVLVNLDEIDFLFVNCEDMNYFEKIWFEKDDSCIVCNKNTF